MEAVADSPHSPLVGVACLIWLTVLALIFSAAWVVRKACRSFSLEANLECEGWKDPRDCHPIIDVLALPRQ